MCVGFVFDVLTNYDIIYTYFLFGFTKENEINGYFF